MRPNGWILLAAAVSCGSHGTEGPALPQPAAIQIVSGNAQSATASTAVGSSPTVVVLDNSGRPIPGTSVSFNVLSGGGWVVNSPVVSDAQGRSSTVWYMGPTANQPQSIEARVGSLSVALSATATRPTVGAAISGANAYVEWVAGELPVVITAPHGGTLLPSEIPDRTVGTTTRDLNTDELASEVVAAFVARFGKRPHLVVSKLHRRKLDPNREIVEAAAGNPIAERAWREYHGFIEASAAEVRRTPGMGFYIDLHGHGHDIQRLELGYLVSSAKLALSDAQLALDLTMQTSSLWPIALTTGTSFPALLRGSASLGAFLEAAGYPSVPSPANPSPGVNPYFEGGYSTERHGTSIDRRFAGVQIEANFDGVRDTAASRAAFAAALVRAVESFLGAHGVTLAGSTFRKAG
jgi:N-formylglutamate amidohydrolase